MTSRDQHARSDLLEKPSKTAFITAFMRALACFEIDAAIRCPDNMAALFLDRSSRDVLSNAESRAASRRQFNRGAYEYIIVRTKLIDKVLLSCLKAGFEQVIVLGAGFDSRGWRFHDLFGNACLFEVDLPSTQAWKQSRLAKHGLSQPEHLHFVASNFNQLALEQDLRKAGFDPDKLTLLIWEGVTPYLPQNAVAEVLNFVSRFKSRSQLVFDYLDLSVLEGRSGLEGAEQVVAWAEQSSEPFLFGLEPTGIADFLAAHKLQLIKNYSPSLLESEFLLDTQNRLFGPTTGFYHIVHGQTL